MLRVTFLGTSSARPTVRRNVSAIAVQREGDLFLFDCGEGTQRQMMRFGVGFSVRAIFVTHLHADHYLGITGLLRTMSLQDRLDSIRLWGPPGSRNTLRQIGELGGERLAFPVEIEELAPGEAARFEGFGIEAFRTHHTSGSVGFRLAEDARLGRFDIDAARRAGVPEGPLFGRLHRGETIELPDGRVVAPEDVVGLPRAGRALVYTGDTLASKQTVEAAKAADLLIHEATFGQDETERARRTGHSTAAEAARIAAEAEVAELVLTHLSARYSDQPHRLEEQAREIFPRTRVAHDGLVVQVPFRQGAVGEGDPVSEERGAGTAGEKSG